MAFSIVGILAVLLEFFRTFLPLILAVVVIDLALLVLALRRIGLPAALSALRRTLPVGAITFIAGLLLVPWITGANHANLTGPLDWLSLVGAALGVAVLATLLAWPPLALLQRLAA
jgi:hypothetical protein